MNTRDAEILSAYLDGQLKPADSARLEARLKSDESLRRLMDDLRLARSLLRQLPQRLAPRAFTLKPSSPKLKAPEPRAYTTLRLAGVLASCLFLASFAVNALTPLASRQLGAESAPVLGGGVGGGPAAASPAEAPVQPFAAAAPSAGATEMPPARGQTPTISQAPAEAAPKALVLESAPPVPIVWQVILASAAVLFNWMSWFVYERGLRKFRSRWQQK